jgi:hypothetical protein
VTALGIIIIWWQLWADHERSRRAKAVELMDIFTQRINDLSPGVRFVRKLLENLDERQCESLWDLEVFKIEAKHKHLVIGCLQEEIKNLKIEEVDGMIHLNQEQVSMLRTMTATYLNILETICAAWRHNVADREIVEDEFGLLIMPKPDHFPLERLRVITGKYPSVKSFSEAIRKNKKMLEKRRIA